ncbi:conserved hypothetical protein, partial [Ricinus communis]
MGRSAKSPLPCTDERRAVMRRCCMDEVRVGVCLIIAVQKSVAKHIAPSPANSTIRTCATNCLAYQHTIRLRQTTGRQERGHRDTVALSRTTRGLPGRLTYGRVAPGPPARGCYGSKGDLPVNRHELIDAVAVATGGSKTNTAEAIDAILETVTAAVIRGETVQLIGFGS